MQFGRQVPLFERKLLPQYSSILKMKLANSSEMLVPIYQTTHNTIILIFSSVRTVYLMYES
jgi:hypothetical protein